MKVDVKLPMDLMSFVNWNEWFQFCLTENLESEIFSYKTIYLIILTISYWDIQFTFVFSLFSSQFVLSDIHLSYVLLIYKRRCLCKNICTFRTSNLVFKKKKKHLFFLFIFSPCKSVCSLIHVRQVFNNIYSFLFTRDHF